MGGVFIKKIIIFIIVLFLIGFLWINRDPFSDLKIDVTKTKEIKKTERGDEFLFKYEYSNFPDSQTIIYIIDKNNNEEIACLVFDGEPYDDNLINLISTSKIRCYEVYNKLIYSVNNEDFKYTDIDQIKEIDPEEYQSLIPICKALVNLNEWKWIKVSAKFLIASGDSDMLSRLQNYAKGQFNQEEIEINKNSKITKKDVQSFSEQFLVTE